MIYDYHHYNNPNTIGNKHIYAYGDYGCSIEFAGFIYADNEAQARVVLKAHNKAWGDNNILLGFGEKTILQEIERRKRERKEII